MLVQRSSSALRWTMLEIFTVFAYFSLTDAGHPYAAAVVIGLYAGTVIDDLMKRRRMCKLLG